MIIFDYYDGFSIYADNAWKSVLSSYHTYDRWGNKVYCQINYALVDKIIRTKQQLEAYDLIAKAELGER